MKLDDCKSVDLTPVNYADRLGWACAAFDEFVHTLDARRFALAAPFAMTAIQALTDEEMQVYFREIGLAPYYADLPRTARENMLFAELANLRKLGTVAAVEALCQYIFGNTPISLEIVDNLAFDSNGNLANASLLNLYDVIVTIDNPVLDPFQLSRIFSNLTRFGRVSQKLRGIVMRYETTTVSAYTGVGSLDSAMFYDNDWVNCTVPPAPKKYTAYFSSNGADNTDVDIGRNTNYRLYDSEGKAIIGDKSKTYSIVGIYKSDGTKITNDIRDHIWVLGDKLLLYSYPIEGHYYLAYKLEYTME